MMYPPRDFIKIAGKGLEPSHRIRYRYLRPTRLPITPPGHINQIDLPSCVIRPALLEHDFEHVMSRVLFRFKSV